MKTRKISIFLSIACLFFAIQTASACSLTDLTSCSFSELGQILQQLMGSSESEQEDSCPSIYLPVCGISGAGYDNICKLNNSDDELAYYGSCLEGIAALSANDCVKQKLEWNGFKCASKNPESYTYFDGDAGIQFSYPEGSSVREDFIELPKAQKNTNLLAKRLAVSTQETCDSIALYTKVKSDKTEIIEGNAFRVVEGSDSLNWGEEISVNINYKDYILQKDENTCVSFLFSLISVEDENFNEYSPLLEEQLFDETVSSVVFSGNASREISCGDLGDFNDDGYLDEEDLSLMEFGTVESNISKKGDLDGSGIVDEEDVSLFNNYLNGNISTFPACSAQEDKIISGSIPGVIWDGTSRINYNENKTQAEVSFDLKIAADTGNVLLALQDPEFSIANKDGVIYDVVWSTSAPIEDGYAFIEQGDYEWIYATAYLEAKNSPLYTKFVIDGIDYFNEQGEIETLLFSAYSDNIYLNYIETENNLACGSWGDVDGNGQINDEDVLLILGDGELDAAQTERADVTGNGVVNLSDALEIRQYLSDGTSFPVCTKMFTPKIYGNKVLSVEDNGDGTKHISLTFYLDSEKSDTYLPLMVSFNQDDENAGIYFAVEKDGSVAVENLQLFSGADPGENMLRIKEGTLQWIRIEFDIRAVMDTALVKFNIDKIIYLDEDGERQEIFPEGLGTSDIFLNYTQGRVDSPCENLGDLDGDGSVSISDYNFLKKNLNLIFTYPDKFLNGDVNRDGKISDEDLEEIDNLLNGRSNTFSGCLKVICSDIIDPVYTNTGEVYSNKCFTKQDDIKCYLDQESDFPCGQ